MDRGQIVLLSSFDRMKTSVKPFSVRRDNPFSSSTSHHCRKWQTITHHLCFDSSLQIAKFTDGKGKVLKAKEITTMDVVEVQGKDQQLLETL